ncbi:MAG: hypothetical protein ACXV7E_07235 [Methylobacter sp.]
MKNSALDANGGALRTCSMRILLRIYLLFARTVPQLFLYPVMIYYWLINRQTTGVVAEREAALKMSKRRPENPVDIGHRQA